MRGRIPWHVGTNVPRYLISCAARAGTPRRVHGGDPPHEARAEGATMNDQQLLAAFESCELASADFPHREHVRVAWTMLREVPALEALPRFVGGLQRFADFHGATDL